MRKPLEPPGHPGRPSPAKTPPHPPQRILVVDDDESMLQVYSRVLTTAGYHVDVAEDGAVGWKSLQAVSYDLLITDNSMPKLSGVELVGKLRSARMTLPAILASGTPPINTESLQLAAMLLKPFPREHLLQTVKEVLRGHVPVGLAPNLKEFVRRLLAYESTPGSFASAPDSAASRVCEKLRGPLGKLMGVSAYHSLVSRAVALAGREAPWLLALRIKADGSLEGFDKPGAKPDSHAVAEGEVLLLSHLLGLLVILIGLSLTQWLLHDTWVKMDDLFFEPEERHEEK